MILHIFFHFHLVCKITFYQNLRPVPFIIVFSFPSWFSYFCSLRVPSILLYLDLSFALLISYSWAHSVTYDTFFFLSAPLHRCPHPAEHRYRLLCYCSLSYDILSSYIWVACPPWMQRENNLLVQQPSCCSPCGPLSFLFIFHNRMKPPWPIMCVVLRLGT